MAVGLLTVVLISTACGSPPAEKTTVTPTPEPIEVTIIGSDFIPSTIIVPVGTTVTWINLDPEYVYHTVASDTYVREISFNSRVYFKGTFSYTFTQPGTHNYICDVHDMMEGTVIVE